jgi:carbon-monoxide dehydrogenase medium subunit
MKPPRFDYHAPASVDEALALLARHGDGARVLAGGQSLMPMLNFRLARPAHLVDINRVRGLDGIAAARRRAPPRRARPAARLERCRRSSSGARGSRRRCRSSPSQIRTRGGGSLAHADPAAELRRDGRAGRPRGAERDGERTVKAGLFVAALTSALRPRELGRDRAPVARAPARACPGGDPPRGLRARRRRHAGAEWAGAPPPRARVLRRGRGAVARSRRRASLVGGPPTPAAFAEPAASPAPRRTRTSLSTRAPVTASGSPVCHGVALAGARRDRGRAEATARGSP